MERVYYRHTQRERIFYAFPQMQSKHGKVQSYWHQDSLDANYEFPHEHLFISEMPMVNGIDKEQDAFVSYHAFASPKKHKTAKRIADHLHTLLALYCDIDCEKIGIDPFDAADEVRKLIDEGKFPKECIIKYTGHGLHLIWPIEPTPASAIKKWKCLQHYIFHSLAHLGADPSGIDDVTKLTRIPSSMNCKNPASPRLVSQEWANYCPVDYKGDAYPCTTMSVFSDYMDRNIQDLPLERQKLFRNGKGWVAPTKRLKRQIKGICKGQEKMYSKLQAFLINAKEDLHTLLKMRRSAMEGRRELFCFIYRNILAQLGAREKEGADCLGAIIDNYFDCTEKEKNEWIDGTRNVHFCKGKKESANRVGYAMSRKYIVETLQITEKEQERMLVLHSRKNKRKSKAKPEAEKKRKELAQKRKNAIELLTKNPFFTVRSLSDASGLSHGTTERLMQEGQVKELIARRQQEIADLNRRNKESIIAWENAEKRMRERNAQIPEVGCTSRLHSLGNATERREVALLHTHCTIDCTIDCTKNIQRDDANLSLNILSMHRTSLSTAPH